MIRLNSFWWMLAGVVLGGGVAVVLLWRPASRQEFDGMVEMGRETSPASGAGAGERRILYWRAPMDANYTSDRPGKSPMGMDLVPVHEDETSGDGGVRVSQSFLQNFAVRTAEVVRGSMPVLIRTVGALAHNEERLVSINTKFEGWIERAQVNNVGELVEEGDVLFEIYSPRLLTTQREYLAAMDYIAQLERNRAYPEAIDRARSLLDAARERLRYWDMTEEQIAAMEEAKTAARTVQFFAPVSGFIVEKTGDSLEGMRLIPGMTVLKIADHSTLWAQAEFYEEDLRHVREGQPVSIEVDAFPGRRWDGRILFFRSAVDQRTRTLTAFAEVANSDLALRPMMYVNVSIEASGPSDVVITPTESVLHSGERAVVIVARGDGVFEPREITLGMASEGMQEVTAGLLPGERVVISSQFLIDSESNLKAAISQLLRGSEAEASSSDPG